MENLSNIINQEELIYSQIKSYKANQDQLKNFIESKVDKNLELYLINDEWLDLWKKYSCFDEIINNPSLNIEKWKEIRKRNKANEITLPDISNNKLFLKANNNNNNNNFTTTKIAINFDSNFHLLNEECYLTLSQGQKKHRVFGKRFEIKAGKIMAKIGDKIMILYKNKTRLNFIFLICSNVDLLNKIYQMLKNKEIIDFLNKTLKINPNCEKQEKKINNCKIIFLNKSYIRIKEDEEKFKQIISSLIDYEYIHFPKLKLSDTIINTNLYLINNNWLPNLKCTLT